ncbi:hypothetical protein JCM10207_000373 [Rhodosporidiobolus poonsookiae]
MASLSDPALLLSFATQAPAPDAALPTPPPKRKRARPTGIALSCAECRRRKIACDKLRPCQQCCRRREAHLCLAGEEGSEIVSARARGTNLPAGVSTDGASTTEHDVEVEQAGPSRFFASAVEFKEAKHTLSLLEKSQEASAVNLAAVQANLTHLNARIKALETANDLLESHSTTRKAPSIGEDTAAFEDAVVGLEEQALGTNLARLARPAEGAFASIAQTAAAPIGAPTHAEQESDGGEHCHPPAGLAKRLEFDSSSLPFRRRSLLDSVHRDLPDAPVLDWLVGRYWLYVDWSWHILHRPTFDQEMQHYATMRRQGRAEAIHPLWLARLFALLASAAGTLDQDIVVHPSWTASWTDASKYLEAAVGALEAADYLAQPKVWSMQTLCIVGAYCSYSGEAALRWRAHHYVAIASRMCQQLGLNRLGFDPRRMPLDDEALPPDVSTLRREVALRVVHSVRILELAMLQFSPCMPSAAIHSAEPGNYDDLALDSSHIVLSQPWSVLTDSSTERFRFRVALLDRNFSEAIQCATPSCLPYDSVLRFDREYRNLLEELPWPFREDASVSLQQALTDAQRWQRILLLQAIYERLLKVHRLHAAQGYHDRTYEYSTLTACATARKTLRLQADGRGLPIVRDVRHILRIQNACIVLSMELWTRFHPTLLNGPDVGLLQSALLVLRDYTASKRPSITNAANQAALVVQFLEQTLQARVARYCESAQEGGLPSFSDLLTAVLAQVKLSSAARGPAKSNSPPAVAAVPEHSGDGVVSGGDGDLDWLAVLGLMGEGAEHVTGSEDAWGVLPAMEAQEGADSPSLLLHDTFSSMPGFI